MKPVERPLTLLLVFCSYSCCAAVASDGLLNITAYVGQNITLPCVTSSLQPFIAVEWSRLDLTLPVLFYKDERLDEIHQHRSFVGRVDLLDREMKDGDLSMIISNVSSSDTGTYECRVKENEGKRRRRAVIDSEPISIVNLTVKHSDVPTENYTDGTTRGHFGVLASLLVLVLFAVYP